MEKNDDQRESDLLFRRTRLESLAAYFLGDKELATTWLQHPNIALGGVTPLSLMPSDSGVLRVEQVLGRIGYGGLS